VGTVVDGVNQVKATMVEGPAGLRLRWIEVFSDPSAR